MWSQRKPANERSSGAAFVLSSMAKNIYCKKSSKISWPTVLSLLENFKYQNCRTRVLLTCFPLILTGLFTFFPSPSLPAAKRFETQYTLILSASRLHRSQRRKTKSSNSASSRWVRETEGVDLLSSFSATLVSVEDILRDDGSLSRPLMHSHRNWCVCVCVHARACVRVCVCVWD